MLSSTRLFQILSLALNAGLRADPITQENLGQLAGKHLQVLVTDWDWGLRMQFGASGIMLSATAHADPDITIQGNAGALLTLVRTQQPQTPGISLSGDMETLHRLKAILHSLDFDSAAWLEPAFGPVVAQVITRQLHAFFKAIQLKKQALAASAGEYLLYEHAVLPNAAELEAFCADVDKLRQDSDRFFAKIRLARASPDIA